MIETATQSGPKRFPPALRLACRRDYIHGERSLPKIAAKNGLKAATVHRWSVAEGWGRLHQAWTEQQMRKDEAVTNPVQEHPERTQFTDYVGVRLTRVRTQIERLDELMMTEIDPQKLDRIASAQTRLSEQERIMADRPLPGSHRPRSEKPKPECFMIEPL